MGVAGQVWREVKSLCRCRIKARANKKPEGNKSQGKDSKISCDKKEKKESKESIDECKEIDREESKRFLELEKITTA